MQYNQAFFFSIVFFFLAFSSVWAHEAGRPANPTNYLPIDPVPLATYGFAIIVLLSLVALAFQPKLSELHKKIIFIVVSVIVIAVTVYAGASTVYLNLISESQGPVHWHADFEIWICGQKMTNLQTSQGFESYVGTPVLHHHNDYRIHVEGLVVKKQDVALHHFFEAIGGELTHTSISVPLNDGTILSRKNGDLCNGQPANLRVFVKNGKTNDAFMPVPELENYVLSPYTETVVRGYPGDLIKIVFDSGGNANGS